MADVRNVIVVGVDGSASSARALEWAMQEGRRRGAGVEAVTAFGHPLGGRGLDESKVVADARHRAETAQAEQVSAVAEPYRAEVSLACEVVEGSAVELLTRASQHAALLVVGSHGFGRLHDVLVGSVAAGCIRRAACPVVVLPAPDLQPLDDGTVTERRHERFPQGTFY